MEQEFWRILEPFSGSKTHKANADHLLGFVCGKIVSEDLQKEGVKRGKLGFVAWS